MSDVPVRLLREMLRDNAATAASPACLDADTLAAWSDGAMSAADRAAAESHAAGCARCQAMLAAMALTAPPAPARSWWRAGTYKWLVPLAAAAAAVVLWVAIPRTPAAPRAGASRTPMIATAAPAPPEPRAADAATVRLKPDTTEATVRPTPGTTEPNNQRATGPIAPQAAAGVQPETRRDARGALGAAVAAPPPAERAQAQAAPRLPGSTPVGIDTFALSAVPAAPPPPAAPAQPSAPPHAASDAIAPQAPLAETVGAAPNANESVQLRRERAAPAQALAKTSAAAPDIVSPDRNVRWRIRTPGSVDRSIDGGLTWQTQAAGVATPLVSGAAPSPAICWVVGRGGVVLRSTDGATWQRVGLSDAIDLIAIRASDATNATITAADGRMFRTADGGKTWQAR
jgi:hypothetical protein